MFLFHLHIYSQTEHSVALTNTRKASTEVGDCNTQLKTTTIELKIKKTDISERDVLTRLLKKTPSAESAADPAESTIQDDDAASQVAQPSSGGTINLKFNMFFLECDVPAEESGATIMCRGFADGDCKNKLVEQHIQQNKRRLESCGMLAASEVSAVDAPKSSKKPKISENVKHILQ